jgi:hypothetical protein
MNADLEKLLSFLLGTVLYKARFTNALSTIPVNYQLYISGTTVLYNKCMLFSQWMPVLPQERKQVPRGGEVIQPFVVIPIRLSTFKAWPEEAQTSTETFA